MSIDCVTASGIRMVAEQIRTLAPAGTARIIVRPWRPLGETASDWWAIASTADGRVLPLGDDVANQLVALIRTTWADQPDLDWAWPIVHEIGQITVRELAEARPR